MFLENITENSSTYVSQGKVFPNESENDHSTDIFKNNFVIFSTHKNPLLGMYKQVFVEISFSRKFFIACITRERFFSSMNPQMTM